MQSSFSQQDCFPWAFYKLIASFCSDCTKAAALLLVRSHLMFSHHALKIRVHRLFCNEQLSFRRWAFSTNCTQTHRSMQKPFTFPLTFPPPRHWPLISPNLQAGQVRAGQQTSWRRYGWLLTGPSFPPSSGGEESIKNLNSQTLKSYLHLRWLHELSIVFPGVSWGIIIASVICRAFYPAHKSQSH